MEAIALIMTKFSEELISAQLAVLFFVSSVAAYWLLIRKKKRESAEWVPAALVRAYLDRMQADERETRMKLFGEYTAAVSGAYAPLATALGSTTVHTNTVIDPNLVKELEALRAQLTLSDQRAMEFDRMMNAIRAEKTALEQKLRDAMSAAAAATPGSAPAGDNPAVVKELADLRARLQEYEVIEDDLANLKKFQKENEQLRQKVEGYEKGGAASTVISGSPPASEPKMVVSGGAEKPAPTMTLVSGGSAPVAEATPAPAPVAAAPAPAPASEANTNVLAPLDPMAETAAAPAPAAAAPAPAAAAGPEKSTQQKEEELLSEFEKMLAS